MEVIDGDKLMERAEKREEEIKKQVIEEKVVVKEEKISDMIGIKKVNTVMANTVKKVF
jgi:hypothetical protein